MSLPVTLGDAPAEMLGAVSHNIAGSQVYRSIPTRRDAKAVRGVDLNTGQVQPNLSKLQLLVIEDDVPVLKACCEIALGMGFVVHGASKVDEARDLVSRHALDVVSDGLEDARWRPAAAGGDPREASAIFDRCHDGFCHSLVRG